MGGNAELVDRIGGWQAAPSEMSTNKCGGMDVVNEWVESANNEFRSLAHDCGPS